PRDQAVVGQHLRGSWRRYTRGGRSPALDRRRGGRSTAGPGLTPNAGCDTPSPRMPRLAAGPDLRPPGPRAPGWLNAVRYLRNPLAFWTELGRTHGDVVYVKLGSYDCYLVN